MIRHLTIGALMLLALVWLSHAWPAIALGLAIGWLVRGSEERRRWERILTRTRAERELEELREGGRSS